MLLKWDWKNVSPFNIFRFFLKANRKENYGSNTDIWIDAHASKKPCSNECDSRLAWKNIDDSGNFVSRQNFLHQKLLAYAATCSRCLAV